MIEAPGPGTAWDPWGLGSLGSLLDHGGNFPYHSLGGPAKAIFKFARVDAQTVAVNKSLLDLAATFHYMHLLGGLSPAKDIQIRKSR